MTNPQGYMFISYRGTQLPAVVSVRRTLEEHGIPVWHDKDNMPPGRLEQGMVKAIRDNDCAGAVVWLSRDMIGSAAIQRIEFPEILKRVRRDDGFFAMFCLADGLGLDDAQSVVSSVHSNVNLKSFLLHPVDRSAEESIRSLARQLLDRRLRLIHSTLPTSGPLKVHIAARAEPPRMPDHALVIDYAPLFSGRFASEQAWQSAILPSLDTVASLVGRCAPNRPLILGGTPPLSLALAAGYAFRTPTSLDARWLQIGPESTSQVWQIEPETDTDRFVIETSSDLLSGEDVAVLVGVTHDPMPAFDASANAALPKFGATVRARPEPERYPAAITRGSEASSLTRMIVRECRGMIATKRPQGKIHIFLAAPAGLAFLLGRQLNTFGDVNCYEHEPSGAIGSYRLSVVLRT